MALEYGEIGPLFQPIVDLRSGRVKGFEALARWHHPTRGTIGPGEFVPLAERTGEIGRISRVVLQESCRALRTWADLGLDISAMTISVNVSASELHDPAFADLVHDTVQSYRLSPSQLVLDVTESSLIDYEQAKSLFAALKEIGVRLSIDDFGMGFSCLDRLHQLPFDFLKLDKSFIDGVGNPGRSRTIVAYLLTLAHDLDMVAVAKGVETRAQLDYLDASGCDLGQGYFWSRAVHRSVAYEQAGRDSCR
jgi:EAL domain-containing protein (putative c-di-GMP-specific phosphodiesterase class I)